MRRAREAEGFSRPGGECSEPTGRAGAERARRATKRRARGFTLIELMIALALAGLVVGGALQLHASFNRQAMRQNEIADMQQTLRVSMLILERAVRQAGSGIQGGKLVAASSDVKGCSGVVVNYYGFDWSDDNTYQDPRIVKTAVHTDGDGTAAGLDPDWFATVSADVGGLVLASGNNGSNVEVENQATADLSSYEDGDLFQIIYPPGAVMGCTINGKSGQDCSLANCTREISAGGAHGGNGGTKYIQHNPAKSNSCFNVQPSKDDCTSNLSAKPPATIHHIAGDRTVYRVMTPSDPLNKRGSPKLTMRVAPIGTAEDDAAHPWRIIAENIEDMQLALIMKDGRICNSIDDLTQCDPTQAAAVRITLVARSSSQIPGMTIGKVGQYEDEAAPTAKDGYLRRSMTAQIEPRNMGSNQ
jgi:prepilin-type N-terminal cleavage/methylation domain-containing protein